MAILGRSMQSMDCRLDCIVKERFAFWWNKLPIENVEDEVEF
jgi:hypothetical protein